MHGFLELLKSYIIQHLQRILASDWLPFYYCAKFLDSTNAIN